MTSHISAQNLRRFGIHFGGSYPKQSIAIGMNYKIIDELEIEAEIGFYRINSRGISLGGKYFYHFENVESRTVVNSISMGANFEFTTKSSVTYAVENIYKGRYSLPQGVYLYPNIGYRFYAKADEPDFFIKEAYIFPIIGYRIGFSTLYPVLDNGVGNANLENDLFSQINNGLNIRLRVGFVF